MPPRTPAKTTPAAACKPSSGGCAIGDLFRVLGRAHMLDLLYVFLHEAEGPMRFVEIQGRLKISPNTLSERLKQMVDAGLVVRTAYNEIPPRVDYEATEKARDLQPVFASLVEWARKHDLKPVASDAAASA